MLTAFQGPLGSWGLMGYLQGALGGPVPDANQDAGPSFLYQGFGFPDTRVLFQKEQVSGRTGVLPQLLALPQLQSANVIPAAYGTATIAALANVVGSVSMTLVTTNTIAASPYIPIVPFSQGWQANAVVTAPLVLDFGFAYATGTTGSNTWTVADSTQFPVGTPLVIAGGGGSATVPLLTWVTSQASATTITTNDNCVASVAAAPVGAGNLWMPREGFSTLYPTAHVPFRAGGIGAFLDPQQALARCVSVTGVAGGAGGAFLVRGWDVYWQPMSELITVAAGANTVYGRKAFKAILSVLPQFTDAHNYSVGTGDTFGFAHRVNFWENTADVAWAGASMTSSTGFLAADPTNPATTTTGDVRGTIQTSANGRGTGIGSTSSNGTVSSLARSGNRLCLQAVPDFLGNLAGSPFVPALMYGQTQT